MAVDADARLRRSTQQALTIHKLVSRLPQLTHDLENNRDLIEEVISTINTLLLPKAWVGTDNHGRLHYTYVKREHVVDPNRRPGPISLGYYASYVWEYSTVDNTVTCHKCRDGRWDVGDIVACNAGASVVT